ncbi:MAG: alpha/beta hydrolase family protein [Balneola sp.]
MEFENISISSGQTPSSEGLPIRWDLYTPISGTSREFPVIIFLHGFKGFKDWGPFPDACEDLARSGFGVLAMNFSLNGVGERRTELDRLDLFERETLSQDLEDIGTIIHALQSGKIQDSHAHLNTDMIGIVGYSRGGHTAIVAAAEYESVQCLVTWSAVGNYISRWAEDKIEDWKANGFIEVENTRTGQIMKVGKVVLEDAMANADRLMAMNRVSEVRIPSLFIHAREDETVPYTDSEELHIECSAKDKELRLISNAGHTFGAAHPFEEDEFPKPFSELLNWTIGWFREHLR